MQKKKRRKRLMSVPRCGRRTLAATAPAPTPPPAQAWRLYPRTVRQTALVRWNSQLPPQRLSARTRQMVSPVFVHAFLHSFFASLIHSPVHLFVHSFISCYCWGHVGFSWDLGCGCEVNSVHLLPCAVVPFLHMRRMCIVSN